MKAVIVAGGEGTRMRGVLGAAPKALIEIESKPLLEHQASWLRRWGFSEIHLCLGFGARAIEERFGNGGRLGVRFLYHVERSPLGTAGAVGRLSRDMGGTEDLLVAYGDVFSDMDLRALVRFHEGRSGGLASLVVFHSDHPQDSDLALLQEERIVSIYRKGSSGGSSPAGEEAALAAVWIVRPRIFEFAPERPLLDFGRDLFPEALRRGEILWGYRSRELLADLGTPERLEEFKRRRFGIFGKKSYDP